MKLIHMLPDSASFYFVDDVFADIERACDSPALGSDGYKLPYFFDFGFTDCGASISFPPSGFWMFSVIILLTSGIRPWKISTIHTSSLLFSVSIVFGVSSDPEMVWIYARSIIARVANQFSIWDGAFVYSPRGAMGLECCKFRSSLFSDSELTIPVSSAFSTYPYPAWPKFGPDDRTESYTVPESLLVVIGKFRDFFWSHISKSLSFVVSVFRWLNPSENALILSEDQ